MFCVVSRWYVKFNLEDTFFTYPIKRESKTAQFKNRAARKKFLHSWFLNTKTEQTKKVLDLIDNSFQQLSAKSL